MVTGSQKNKPATSLWPWRDGAPVGLLVSDGRYQDLLTIANHHESLGDARGPTGQDSTLEERHAQHRRKGFRQAPRTLQ